MEPEIEKEVRTNVPEYDSSREKYTYKAPDDDFSDIERKLKDLKKKLEGD